MASKTTVSQTAQSTTKIPTVQNRIDTLAGQLIAIKDSVTEDVLAKAAKKAGCSSKTGKRYLNGEVAFLHRGEILYKYLLQELSKGITA